jgi:hypothetical protein
MIANSQRCGSVARFESSRQKLHSLPGGWAGTCGAKGSFQLNLAMDGHDPAHRTGIQAIGFQGLDGGEPLFIDLLWI